MKLATLFFLCFSFLLLSGSAHLRLPSPVSLPNGFSLVSNLSKNEQQAQPVSQSKGSCLTSANASGTGYDQFNAVEPEDKDDDDSRFPEWSYFFPSPYQSRPTANLHRYRKDQLPVCLHFALLATDKYITYGVIRI